NQTSPVSNTITTTYADIAFAWTGENNNPSTASWIAHYTNKIDAGTVALVTIKSSEGSASFVMSATADIDGKWQTSTVHLSAGNTYTVAMTEYLPSDTQFTTPLSPTSNPLTLTIAQHVPTTYVVHSGETSSGLVLNSGDSLLVEGGGTALSTTINSGGLQTVESGALASGTVASGTGAAVLVLSGGTASGATLSGGGFDIVFGTAIGTTVNSSTVDDDRGVESGTQVNGGLQVVE